MECDMCCENIEKGTNIYELDFHELNNEFDKFCFCSEECALEFAKEQLKNDECYQLTDDEFRKKIFNRYIVG